MYTIVDLLLSYTCIRHNVTSFDDVIELLTSIYVTSFNIFKIAKH